MDTTQELLWGTFRDLEATHRIPRSSAYAHLENGDFRSKRVGGRRLIDMRSVEEFFNSCPDKPPKELSREMVRRASRSAGRRTAK